jgi:sulfoxide reductase heme-binding subunit YedZ
MPDDLLLKIARVIGLLGLALLIVSSIGGTLLASRTAQRINFLKGKTFTYHRTVSIVGAALFLLHPVPLLLAHATTGMRWWNVFVPFTAPKQGILIAWGTVAAYTLLVVTASSLNIKKMPRRQWRAIHYGSYAVLALGLVHALTISNEFARYEPFRIEEPDKFLLAVVAVPVVLLFPLWRIVAAQRLRARKAS